MGAEKLVNVVLSGLGWELKFIRNGRGLSLEVVCQQLRWQQSKLSRMENGQQHISDVDLGALLAIYEVHGDERRRLLRLADRQDDPGRWELDSPIDDAPNQKGTFRRLESEAISLVDAQTTLMPGLVQTSDYTRAVMKGAGVLPELIEQRIEKRMSRKSILIRDVPPKFEMIMDEAALRRVIGGRAVMARQLRTLLEVAERPNVRMWVLPFERSGDAAFHHPFYLMTFERGKSVVFLESKCSRVFLESDEKIDFFRRHAAKVANAALNPAASMEFVARMRKEYERE